MQTRDLVFNPSDLVLHSLKVLFIANVRTKREVCSYNQYRNIEEIPKSKSRSMLPRLCPTLACFSTAHFPLLTVYLPDKLEPCSFSRSRDIHRGPKI